MSTGPCEFIDMEHTPKNLLIRAVRQGETARRGAKQEQARRETAQLTDFLNIRPTLQKLLRYPLTDMDTIGKDASPISVVISVFPLFMIMLISINAAIKIIPNRWNLSIWNIRRRIF